MIIHSYLTKGMLPWAKPYLKSLNYYHSGIKVILSTRDLDDKDIDLLHSYHGNLDIRNEPFNLDGLCLTSGKSISDIERYKYEIENKIVNEENKIWKQFVSVEDRYRTSIIEVFEECINLGGVLLHTDIDIFFKRPIHELIEFTSLHDISIKFRLNHNKEKRKVQGGVIGFKLKNEVLTFLYRWFYHIDKIPLIDKPIGYGQTSFYYAYKDMKQYYKWGDIPEKFISPRFDDDVIISAGNSKYGKEFILKYYNQQLKKMNSLSGRKFIL